MQIYPVYNNWKKRWVPWCNKTTIINSIHFISSLYSPRMQPTWIQTALQTFRFNKFLIEFVFRNLCMFTSQPALFDIICWYAHPITFKLWRSRLKRDETQWLNFARTFQIYICAKEKVCSWKTFSLVLINQIFSVSKPMYNPGIEKKGYLNMSGLSQFAASCKALSPCITV